MKVKQINALLAALGEIRDQLAHLRPAVVHVPQVGPSPYFVDVAFEPPAKPDEEPVEGPTAAQRAAWMREALTTVLEALDGWIESAHENHGALDHRGEPRGGECWRQFHPQDIRLMVGDAARQLKIEAPEAAGVPKEDVVGL